ncbi:MAG: methyltransferase domain-containing protein [Pseudomonadota bacterium]
MAKPSQSELGLFLSQLRRRPNKIVALSPSSTRLARKMCLQIDATTGPVIELGAGTGRITRAILASGVPEDQIAAYEINPDFAQSLRAEFPNLRVVEQGAEELRNAPVERPGAVISGLPLLTFSEASQSRILTAAFAKMRPGGLFIQFTYGFHTPVARSICKALDLEVEMQSTELWNLPPAQVYVFRQRAAVRNAA